MMTLTTITCRDIIYFSEAAETGNNERKCRIPVVSSKESRLDLDIPVHPCWTGLTDLPGWLCQSGSFLHEQVIFRLRQVWQIRFTQCLAQIDFDRISDRANRKIIG